MIEKMTYSVPEVADLLGISIPKAYELAHQPDFPKLKIGKRMVVPKKEFELWITSSVNANKE
ncbi:MAG: helix-turn-helix domain-containing protein [Eubacteriaceae bacterium]